MYALCTFPTTPASHCYLLLVLQAFGLNKRFSIVSCLSIDYQHQLASDSATVLTVSLDSLISVVYELQLLQHTHTCLSHQIRDFNLQRPVLARTGPGPDRGPVF
jgi:hypothetical protein